jgi:DNA mismatch endonuclease (patch repair protein)
VAVDIRGCSWHGCPEHGTEPRANADWWRAKLAANRARDADTEARLGAADWMLLVVWEHEDPNEAARRVAEIVSARRLLHECSRR